MKRNIIKFTTMALMLMGGTNVNAQIDLGNIIGGITGNSNSSNNNNLISTLTSIFSSNKQATSDNIVGTWSSDSPAIVL